MRHVIYVATPENQQLQVLNINSNEKLEIIQTIKTNGESQPMVIFNNRLYVGMRPNFHITTYDIQCTGKLKKIGESSIPGSPNYLSIDKINNFLLCASYAQGSLTISRINNLGIPNVSLQTLYNIDGCHYCDLNYNKILFVTSLKKNCIYLYYITNAGKIKKYNPHTLKTEKGIGPRHITFHPNKKCAYSINELNSTIDVWKLTNDSKNIKNIQNISILPNNFHGTPWAADIHVHPFHSCLYACDRNASLITLLKINPYNNLLNVVDYIKTEKQPRSFAISKNGEYLIVAGEISNNITLYLVSKNSFSLQKKHNICVGNRPIWVCMHTLP